MVRKDREDGFTGLARYTSSGAEVLVGPLKGRLERSRKVGDLGPELTPAGKPGASSLHILASTHRSGELPFRTPELE